MPSETIILSGGGINWSWYLEIEVLAKRQCKIINHYRLHNYRDQDHPETVGRYYIEEDEKPIADGWHSRNAIGVRVWREGRSGTGRRYKVVNPGYVFGYDGKTDQPEMHGV